MVFFSPDGSGILTQTMAMRSVSAGGVEATATLADTLVRTLSARQIQADSRFLLLYFSCSSLGVFIMPAVLVVISLQRCIALWIGSGHHGHRR